MNIEHFMRSERSGLAFTTLEIVKAEEQQGHRVLLREPTGEEGMPGKVLYGDPDLKTDVECIHSQMPLTSYFNRKPKLLFCHGEPLSSVGNGVSMKAIIDMAPKVDAFICMRKEEYTAWNSIKRTYVVPKGIDLERFHPVDVKPHDDSDPTSKLSGEPAVLYVEHWRGQRNPLTLCIAMQAVWMRYPKARLHLYNVTDQRMYDTFKALNSYAKMWPFLRTINGPVDDADVNSLYNKADIVVSCLDPLYARSIEALGAGKAFLGPGYKSSSYPYHCDLDADSMAAEICRIWDEYGKVDFRKYAEQFHDVQETVRQCTAIYQRYL